MRSPCTCVLQRQIDNCVLHVRGCRTRYTSQKSATFYAISPAPLVCTAAPLMHVCVAYFWQNLRVTGICPKRWPRRTGRRHWVPNHEDMGCPPVVADRGLVAAVCLWLPLQVRGLPMSRAAAAELLDDHKWSYKCSTFCCPVCP